MLDLGWLRSKSFCQIELGGNEFCLGTVSVVTALIFFGLAGNVGLGFSSGDRSVTCDKGEG